MYQTIGFIGTGTMGGVLARAAAQGSPASQLFFANRTPSKAQELAAELHGQAASNEEIAKACTLIFLGVKPQMMAGVLAELGPVLAGREALKAAMRGEGGKMVGFIREETPDGSYRISVRMIPIEEVMLYEKVIPEEYINERGNDVREGFVQWCKPLIGAEVPEYIDFQDLYREKEEK